MDSTPKPASRLSKVADSEVDCESEQTPRFIVEFAPSPSPPNRKTPSSMPSKLSIKPRNCVPLQDLLLLSPSPVRRSRTRLSDRVEMGDDPVDPRRRCKARTGSIGLLGCASPRNGRRSRRRYEGEVREERELGLVDEVGVKPRRRRHSGKSKKEKISLGSTIPSSSTCLDENEGDQSRLDHIGEMIWDLIMWRDVAKSSLWFGFGCLCFLSSCFAHGLSFSLFSMISQLGILFLGVSFFSNSLHQRDNGEKWREVKLKEDDILRLIRVLLPALNLAILKTRTLFSGEPSTTLRVAIFLMMGAEYGHILTLRRLFALGAFASFTAPKLYSLYSAQINKNVEHWKARVLEAWRACSHKKIVAASAATVFWNLSSLKTRIFTAFISIVILRYYRQNSVSRSENDEDREKEHQPQLQKEVPAVKEQEEPPEQALVVADVGLQKQN